MFVVKVTNVRIELQLLRLVICCLEGYVIISPSHIYVIAPLISIEKYSLSSVKIFGLLLVSGLAVGLEAALKSHNDGRLRHKRRGQMLE